MQALKIFKRTIRILAKVLLGLFTLIFLAVALIHVPFIQKQITQSVSNYLSDKVGARVEIQNIRFSLKGNAVIEELAVWDKDNKNILSVQKIEVNANTLDLIKEDILIKEVSISGLNGKLIQNKAGLNIQFIIDAFSSSEKPDTTKRTSLNLQFKKIFLENILFEFNSEVNKLSVKTHLGKFLFTDVSFHTQQKKIKAKVISLEHTSVNVFSSSQTSEQNISANSNHKLFVPDFGTGMIFEVNKLEFNDNNFSFHKVELFDTSKFEPSHLTLKNIHLALSDIFIHPDTLVANLESLTLKLSAFEVTRAEAAIQSNDDHFTLSGIHLASGDNELHASLTAPLDLNSIKSKDHSPLEIDVLAEFNPNDIVWFVNDSVMNLFKDWGHTSFAFNGESTTNEGEIKTLNLKTSNSQIQAAGKVKDFLDVKNISWNHMLIDASFGSDFTKTIKQFVKNIRLPQQTKLQLTSSGNTKNIVADGNVFTGWGTAKIKGHADWLEGSIRMDMNVNGEKINLAEWLGQPMLGLTDISAKAKGTIGNNQQIEISGLISEMEVMTQPIHQLAFQATTYNEQANIHVTIADPHYQADIHSEIFYAGPLTFTNQIELDSFRLGSLLHRDSTLLISGNTKSIIKIEPATIEGRLACKDLILHKQTATYSLDSLILNSMVSPDRSDFLLISNYAKANLKSNFDIREAGNVFKNIAGDILTDSDKDVIPKRNRIADFNIDLENANFLKLIGINTDEFASLNIAGKVNEEKQIAKVEVNSGKFSGYGVMLDTLYTSMTLSGDTITGRLNVNELLYDSIHLGNLYFDIQAKGDTAISNLQLMKDSITLLGLQTHILPADSGAMVYPDKLRTFNHDYLIYSKAPVYVARDNVTFKHFSAAHDDTQINLNGNLNAFEVTLKNIDLTPLNYLLSPDTTMINKGRLDGTVSYTSDHQLNLLANVDSLSLYNSNPLKITASAASKGTQMPFEFMLTNTSNKIDLNGTYFSDNSKLDASLLADINNPEIFQFLVSQFIENVTGSVKGKAAITGSLDKPELKGAIRFSDLALTTVNPKLTFNITDDSIILDNSALRFNHFTLYDKEKHPLTIDGSITSENYKSFAYDLDINSNEYALINNPDSTSGKLRGLLVIDSDIKLKGNKKDTNIEAKLKIKNASDITVITASDDIELLKTEGIIDFIDPAQLLDSLALETTTNFYDSLIASLPDFKLNSSIVIEDNATFRVVIDEQSGDYIEASGAADLELGYDRTGNLGLAGNYTIGKGLYRLSFYDLVKKNFTLVQGSSINWHGSPKNGDLNIKAVHTVESNSLGLIGHEIGENEKSIYKRSLDYEVGINISGTIEKPVISFSLDLPKNEKVSYPVLANKLDRLRQPEYESELNKQVFGLLVLGGFLPETSGADINSNLIATTALSNSVNSLLASQLNRFASQYIKGVNIDVGIQSFSDYSAPGGKTQTAMDFRVSKKVMNDRLSFEIGGDFDINQDQSGANTGKNYRGDIAIIYDLTGNGDKQLKLFNNQTYDIIYQEIRNTGVSLIFIREFDNKEKDKQSKKNQ